MYSSTAVYKHGTHKTETSHIQRVTGIIHQWCWQPVFCQRYFIDRILFLVQLNNTICRALFTKHSQALVNVNVAVW